MGLSALGYKFTDSSMFHWHCLGTSITTFSTGCLLHSPVWAYIPIKEMVKNGNIAMLGIVLVVALGLSLSEAVASTKKGVGIDYDEFMCGDFAALGEMNWWYDWHLNPFYYYEDQEYTPDCPNLDLSIHDHNHYSMKWGRFNPLKTYELRDYATVLLGFNEPNHYKQARMWPQLAAEHWPQIEALATSNGLNLSIASPAAAPCGSDDPKKCLMRKTYDWFDQFYGNCTEMYGEHGCRVDYTTTHWYGCLDDMEWLLTYLKKLWNKYDRPVWLTEFACPSEDPQEVLAFMQDVLPRLENKHFVDKYAYTYQGCQSRITDEEIGCARYAWFASRIVKTDGYVKPTATLLKADSSELTELGQYYVNFEPSTTTK